MSARRGIAPLLIAALLGGCATGSSVKLFSGENGAATGGVAVLDPETGEDRAFIDQAMSKARVGAKGARVRKFDEAKLKPGDRALMGFLPPRAFAADPLKFVNDTDDLAPGADTDRVLGEIQREIRTRDGAEVVIIGHTDSTGEESYNDALSLARAEKVRETLIAALGIDPSTITVAGRGEREPLPGHEGDERADRENRRVQVIVR